MNHCRRMAVLSLVATLGLCAQASAATVTISPLPGTSTALPKTQISFLGASPGSLSSISVVGSSSGRHRGHLRSYFSAIGASFEPSKPFKPGERVTVHAKWATATGKRSKISTSFTIASPAAVAQSEFPSVPGTPADVQNFQSLPNLHPPTVTVREAAGSASAPGYVFASPFLGPGEWGPMIFDSAGNLVWFHPLPPRTGRGRLPHAGLRRQERAHVVAGQDAGARIRPGRGRDHERQLPDGRRGESRQRPAGRRARVHRDPSGLGLHPRLQPRAA